MQQNTQPFILKLVGKRTQFVPLQRYQRRDRWFIYYLIFIHLIAVYGLFSLIQSTLQWLEGANP